MSIRQCTAESFKVPPELYAIAVLNYIETPGWLSKAPPGAPDLLREEADVAILRAVELGASRGYTIKGAIASGAIATEVFHYAKKVGAGLIVAGTHGRKGLARTLLGSTCEQLLRHSDIPLLTVGPAVQWHAESSAKSSRTL